EPCPPSNGPASSRSSSSPLGSLSRPRTRQPLSLAGHIHPKPFRYLPEGLATPLATKNVTEHSGQPDPAEALQRTVSKHSHQLHSNGATLRTLLDQQRQISQQLEQMATLFQQALGASGHAAAS
ncbi:hypothetical protein CRENBAI_002489, partial [Crenichthys baileyi]